MASSKNSVKNGNQPTQSAGDIKQMTVIDAVDILNSALQIVKESGLRVTGTNHPDKGCGVLFLWGLKVANGMVVLGDSTTPAPAENGTG